MGVAAAALGGVPAQGEYGAGGGVFGGVVSC